MTAGEKIRACRQAAGLSQEKVAELVGVSRQAVTKWESGQSAPSTENLLRLAEVLGTTVDLLVGTSAERPPLAADQSDFLYRAEGERRRIGQQQKRRKNRIVFAAAAAGYLFLYLIGRLLWCDRAASSWMGWLITAVPSGESSYLFGWLLSSRLFWVSMAVSCVPALWGKFRFTLCTLAGFLAGLLTGTLLGPHPAGAFYGHSHYGWAIWGGLYLLSAAVGLLLERLAGKRRHKTAPE